MSNPLHERYDVVIIGGAFAGASTALLLLRMLPGRRVLIIERQAQFNRKVGEATVEVSACFLHRTLGLYDYLSREQLPKHGLRYWFTDGPERRLEEMTEIGSIDAPRLPSFQLDRAKLDEHVLELAATEGADVARPARVVAIDQGWPQSTVRFSRGEAEHAVTARWVVDASGRQAFIARRRKLHERVDEHPTAAVWARWRNVRDLDHPAIARADDIELPEVQASRRLATNHFCGYGWWCWVIPLAGGETSIGVVYNKELFSLDGEGKPREQYREFVTTQAGLRDLLRDADMDDDDFHALGHLPYKTSRYMDKGWALVGDAASFMDPYYSPGLDHVAMSIYATTMLVHDELMETLGDAALQSRIDRHNTLFLRSYDRWLEALYLGKYELMGDAELLRCAFLVDTSLYYLGVVGPVYGDRKYFGQPPFGLNASHAAFTYKLMRGFNRRMVAIARARRKAGVYGRRNAGWHSYSPAFGLRQGSLAHLTKGLYAWLKMELQCVLLRFRPQRRSDPQADTVAQS